MGDPQMESYFVGGGSGGVMCEDVITGPQFDNVFQRIEDMYQASLEALGGEYIKQPHEKHRTCAIRLASSLFFEVRAGRLVCRELCC